MMVFIAELFFKSDIIVMAFADHYYSIFLVPIHDNIYIEKKRTKENQRLIEYRVHYIYITISSFVVYFVVI